MTKNKNDGLLGKERAQAVHWLDNSKKPGEIAYGTEVHESRGRRSYTTDPDSVTCRDCWRLSHPQSEV